MGRVEAIGEQRGAHARYPWPRCRSPTRPPIAVTDAGLWGTMRHTVDAGSLGSRHDDRGRRHGGARSGGRKRWRPFVAAASVITPLACVECGSTSGNGDHLASGAAGVAPDVVVEGGSGGDAAGGAEPTGGRAAETACEPGRQIACACGGATEGYQICLEDGSAWDRCVCPDPSTQSSTGTSTETGVATGRSITYVRLSATNSVTDLDLKAFIDDAVARGQASSSNYLKAIEAGFEIWDGGEGTQTTSYSATVN